MICPTLSLVYIILLLHSDVRQKKPSSLFPKRSWSSSPRHSLMRLLHPSRLHQLGPFGSNYPNKFLAFYPNKPKETCKSSQSAQINVLELLLPKLNLTPDSRKNRKIWGKSRPSELVFWRLQAVLSEERLPIGLPAVRSPSSAQCRPRHCLCRSRRGASLFTRCHPPKKGWGSWQNSSTLAFNNISVAELGEF